MAKYGYEVMFILDSNVYARNPGDAGDGIAKLVNNAGGEILASRLWNEQKLAYPVKGRYKGTYWLTYCRMDGTRVSEFNRACQLNDMILRHLIVRIDERLIEPLVAAALGRGSEKDGDTESPGDSEGETERRPRGRRSSESKEPATAEA